jgi:hypothetical protein
MPQTYTSIQPKIILIQILIKSIKKNLMRELCALIIKHPNHFVMIVLFILLTI